MEAKDLIKLKERIEKEKIKKAQLEGELRSLMNSLKSNWGCDSTEEAKELLQDMKKKYSKMEEELEEGLKELEEKYYGDSH